MEGKPKRVEISDEHLLKIKEETEKLYRETKPVSCPYLTDNVVFNAKGLDHMKFKSFGRPRSKYDQYTRLKLFNIVSSILSKSHTLQGFKKIKALQRINRKDGWTKIDTEIIYYEFIAVKGKVRVKIIVKKISNSDEYFFWSVIPFWKMTGIPGEREISDGNPEED
jgi:hypothetical protein